MTIIDLIRHGEPQGGRAYRGHGVDDPLSEKGWEQMRQAVAGAAPWQHIVTSPMRRCCEFAQELAQNQGLPMQTEARFKVGFGDWEGRTPEQIQAENPQQYQDFYADPVNCRPPGAEPLDQFRTRVETAFAELLQQHAGKHVLLVSHAGVMRAIIAGVLGASGAGMYRIKVENAGLSRIRHSGEKSVLEFVNAAFL